MKYFLKIALSFVIGILVFAACSDSDNNSATVAFSVSKDNITMGAEGGKEGFVVQTMNKWSVVSAPDWVTVSPANGFGTATCEVNVQSSSQNDLRSGSIKVRSGAEERMIAIEQTGFSKAVTPKKSEVEIESFGKEGERYFDVEIVTNIEFKEVITSPTGESVDWLIRNTEDDVEFVNGARPRTIKLRFDYKLNAQPEERIAEIHFVPVNEEDELNVPSVITVRQEAAVKIEDNRAGDSIAVITIYHLLNGMTELWDTSERMDNWEGVTLWEATDKDKPCDEAVGRVRSVSYSFFKTEASLPEQIKHLKYLESLFVLSNVNTMLKSIELGPEICELKYLKELQLFSYGIVSLPDEFVKLGETLEVLDLSANNLEEIPAMLTKENFPKLKSLCLTGQRRWTMSDLTKKENYEDGIGLNIQSTKEGESSLRRLLLWDTLEELRLQNCYIEGELPEFEVGKDGVVAYTQDDVDAFGGDTIQWLADNNMPKILPNVKKFAINLNFFTGELPQWLLYHPHLIAWIPELLIFNQQEQGRNSNGDKVGFDNVPTNFEYFYEAFPQMRAKYELKDVLDDEE